MAQDIPATATAGQYGKIVGLTERVIAGRKSDGRLPVAPSGGIDLHAVIRAGHASLGMRQNGKGGIGANGFAAAVERDAEAAAKLPACVYHLTDPVDIMAVLSVMSMAHRQPCNAASLSNLVGAPLEVSHATSRGMTMAVMIDAADVLDSMGVPAPPGCASWDEADMWDMERFSKINWPALAAVAGKPVDEAAWRAYGDARLNDAPEPDRSPIPKAARVPRKASKPGR